MGHSKVGLVSPLSSVQTHYGLTRLHVFVKFHVMTDCIEIFKSTDPAEFAEAAAELKRRGLPFETRKTDHGNYHQPQTCFSICVEPQYESEARAAIEDISGGVVWPSNNRPVHSFFRFEAWLVLIGLLFLALMILLQLAGYLYQSLID